MLEERIYGVFKKGGSIGAEEHFVKVGLTKEEASEYAKMLRKTLSRGEKEYYRITYTVRKVVEL